MSGERKVIWVLVLVLVVGAIAVAGPPILSVMAKKYGGRSCTLREIGLAMFQYANEHDQRCPADFGVLLGEHYLMTAVVFVHPLSGNRVPADFPTDFANAHPAVLHQVHDWGDYALAPGVAPDSGADTIIIYERKAIYPGERGCYFNDGHVQWLPEAEFQERMRAQCSREEKEWK